MTRIQELQGKIKAVRAEARAEVQRLQGELESAKADRKAELNAKAIAKADRAREQAEKKARRQAEVEAKRQAAITKAEGRLAKLAAAKRATNCAELAAVA